MKVTKIIPMLRDRHSVTHHDSKAKQTELVRASLRQHSVFNAFFTYGALPKAFGMRCRGQK